MAHILNNVVLCIKDHIKIVLRLISTTSTGIPLPIAALSAGFHPHDYITHEGRV